MARKVIYVSDLSDRELDEKDAAQITVKFSDARRGVYVVDAHPDDDMVRRLMETGRKQARRGRKARPASPVEA